MALITQELLDKLHIIRREQSPSVRRDELGEYELIDMLIEMGLVREQNALLELTLLGEYANSETELYLIYQHIVEFGKVDGEHHKQWMIDQILRLVCKRFDWDYETVIELDFDNEWDNGIPP